MEPQLGMFDAAIAACGGKDWTYSLLDAPQCMRASVEDLAEPISLRDFVSNVCRDAQSQKTVAMIMDYKESVPEFGSANLVVELISKGQI